VLCWLCWLAWLYCLARKARPVREGGMRIRSILSVRPALVSSPFMTMDERILIETASRQAGVSPAEFLREAGVALASELVEGKGRGGRGTRHPCQPAPHSRQRG
jgi:hypothetical protein